MHICQIINSTLDDHGSCTLSNNTVDNYRFYYEIVNALSKLLLILNFSNSIQNTCIYEFMPEQMITQYKNRWLVRYFWINLTQIVFYHMIIFNKIFMELTFFIYYKKI